VGIARTEQICSGPGAVRSPGVQASLGFDRRRDPPRPVVAIEFASPARRQVLSPQGHGLQAFPSLCRVRAEGRGLEPPRVQSDWDAATGPVGNAGRSTAPAPQSKPVTPASRLVAQITPLVAFGLGLRILAAGPAPFQLYSYCGRCEPDLKSLLGLVRGRGHRLIPRQRPARLPRSLPAAESLTETATPGDRTENWDIRPPAIERHRPQVLRSDDETRAITSAGPAARSYKTIRSTSAPRRRWRRDRDLPRRQQRDRWQRFPLALRTPTSAGPCAR
jgi:hypothetical protein